MRASVSIAAVSQDATCADALREALINGDIQVPDSGVAGTQLLVVLCSRHSAHSSANPAKARGGRATGPPHPSRAAGR